jgi:hypothetical protein
MNRAASCAVLAPPIRQRFAARWLILRLACTAHALGCCAPGAADQGQPQRAQHAGKDEEGGGQGKEHKLNLCDSSGDFSHLDARNTFIFLGRSSPEDRGSEVGGLGHLCNTILPLVAGQSKRLPWIRCRGREVH